VDQIHLAQNRYQWRTCERDKSNVDFYKIMALSSLYKRLLAFEDVL